MIGAPPVPCLSRDRLFDENLFEPAIAHRGLGRRLWLVRGRAISIQAAARNDGIIGRLSAAIASRAFYTLPRAPEVAAEVVGAPPVSRPAGSGAHAGIDCLKINPDGRG